MHLTMQKLGPFSLAELRDFGKSPIFYGKVYIGMEFLLTEKSSGSMCTGKPLAKERMIVIGSAIKW